jgi:uncharacterized protein (DUF2267 family)
MLHQNPVEAFWGRIRRRWHPTNEQELRNVTEAVLTHFRLRLPGNETAHMFAQLPDEIEALSRAPDVWQVGPDAPDRPTEDMDLSTFYQRVAHDGGVDYETVLEATKPILMSLKKALPAEEVSHAQDMLPPDMKDFWAGL